MSIVVLRVPRTTGNVCLLLNHTQPKATKLCAFFLTKNCVKSVCVAGVPAIASQLESERGQPQQRGGGIVQGVEVKRDSPFSERVVVLGCLVVIRSTIDHIVGAAARKSSSSGNELCPCFGVSLVFRDNAETVAKSGRRRTERNWRIVTFSQCPRKGSSRPR